MPSLNLNVRVFLVYFALIGVAAYWGFNVVSSQVKPTIRQVTEESLVESANLLAEFAVAVLQSNHGKDAFSEHIEGFMERQYQATIFGVKKESSSIRIYITDHQGVVVFDSQNKAVGQDYSQWNDVYLTLKGQYGARSTWDDPNDESSSVMYVAAPVMSEQEIIGVLTIAKKNQSLRPFFGLIDNQLKYWGTLLLVLSLIVGGALSYWLTGSIRKLVSYAKKLTKGEVVDPPILRESELNTLAQAMKTMRQELAGKEYIEEYLLTMTHEMKSPLSAIMGAAELIDPQMPAKDLERFSHNIQLESQRLDGFIQRMLEVARIENLANLEQVETVKVNELIKRLIAQKQVEAIQKNVQIHDDCSEEFQVQGSEFMLLQVLDNILGNALEFSPINSEIHINCIVSRQDIQLTIQDQGPGIPDYALNRIFERFYSLPRPHTGKRSSGLGLTFAKRAIELHQGTITLRNRITGGGEVVISLPLEMTPSI
jgi:two-component system sensor histidine kinase CreC